ncbi:MAG TPA: hypothetical protein VK861_09735, partial [Bacteroidales bacterium]|nr:hypothetical protein [Bacteroidales bacterium]
VMDVEDVHDSAMPSGNSMAALSLGKLWSLTGKGKYKMILEKIFDSLGGEILEEPIGFSFLLTAYRVLAKGPKEVVLSGDLKKASLDEMKKALSGLYVPDYTFVNHDPDQREKDEKLFSHWRELEDGKGTAYVCRDFTCSLGVHDVLGLIGLIGHLESE